MKDFPLRASIFYRFPTSIKECENMKHYIVLNNEHSGGYCGLDGLIMAEVIKKFRFNLTLIRPKGYQNYGYVTREGKVTGTLGNIVHGEADIAFNSRFLADYGTTGFNFLMYTSSDALCVLVNRPEDIPLWLFPYKDVYDNYVMLLIACSFAVAGVFLWLLQRFSTDNKRKGTLRLREIVLDTIVAGTCGFSIKPTKNSFILKASCFFSSTIFMATFQGHVNYAFTTVKSGDDIKTLQDLYDSGLEISTSPSIKALIEPPYNELQSALIDRMVIGKENNTLQETLSAKMYAALDRRSDVLLEIQKFHTDELGVPLFNVVEECFRTYYLSIIVRPEFPFAEHVKVVLERLQAAGLPSRYYEWTRHSLGISGPAQAGGSSGPRPATPVSIEELRIAFSVLLAGYIVSSIVLTVERRLCPCRNRGRFENGLTV
ncbi:hypothetical protein EVAR_18453_1 [Eumeta japonica]|uniref:Uncharacterized protein n=1 Tax=Eumeta variegata TaxID=151549 RepID=A0A4C1V1G5_EUMVA|nr:hypothetical protein EVAR_18453_1 [Eumeta japonica]